MRTLSSIVAPTRAIICALCALILPVASRSADVQVSLASFTPLISGAGHAVHVVPQPAGATISATTDANGLAEFRGLSGGTWMLIIDGVQLPTLRLAVPNTPGPMLSAAALVTPIWTPSDVIVWTKLGLPTGANWTSDGSTNSVLPGKATAFSGSFSDSLTLAGSKITEWASVGGTPGAIINSGTPSFNAIPTYLDNSGTNVQPSLALLSSGQSLILPGFESLSGQTNQWGDSGTGLTFNGLPYPAFGYVTNLLAQPNDPTKFWDGTGHLGTPAGTFSGTAGSVINSGTPVTLAVPTYNGVTGTNIQPSSVTIGSLTNINAGATRSQIGWFTNGVSGGGWYNVKDPAFGARGDGTTDDTAAIQATLTAATAVGGVCYLPPGIYKITTNLVMTSPISLVGSGRPMNGATNQLGSIIDATALGDTQIGIQCLSGPNTSQTYLGHFQIRGSVTTPTQNNIGISMANGTYLTLDDVDVRGFGKGVNLSSVYYVTIRQCIFGGQLAPIRSGLTLSACQSVSIRDCLFANTYFGPNIWITGQTFNIDIADCLIDECFGNDPSVKIDATPVTFQGWSLTNSCLISLRSSYVICNRVNGTGGLSTAANTIGVTLQDVYLTPFNDTTNNTTMTIRGSSHRFENVFAQTGPGLGPGITDTSTSSVWINREGMSIGSITNLSLTASRALVSGSDKTIASSATTATELGYVNGVTSAIQTQIDLKAPLLSPALTGTPTINGQSVETQLTNKVAKAGDTMTGPLTVTSGTGNAPILTLGGYSLTGSDASSAVNITGTWNTSGNPTAFKVNITNTTVGGTAKLFDFQIGNSSKANLDQYGNLTTTGGFTANGAGNGLSLNSASDFINFNFGDLQLLEDSAATLQLGPDAATATAQTIKAHDGVGTDKSGAKLTLEGGQPTGTGRGGALAFATGESATSTGSSAGAYIQRFYCSAKGVDLTGGSATLVFNVSLASGKSVGLHIFATTRSDDGTDFQSSVDDFTATAINKAGTVTPSAVSTSLNTTATSLGTISTLWTAVANGNGVDIKCNTASTVITPTTRRVKWRVEIDSNDTALVVMPQ